jgi:predicted aminopeptidase
MEVEFPKVKRVCAVLIIGVGYYIQAIRGELHILTHRNSIEKLIAGRQTPAKLREQLQLVQRLRTFAGTELRLPVDGNYDKYVDVHREYVVWNVQAAPKFSLNPKIWKYPFVGGLAYRGFFSENSARDYGNSLKKQGFDVYVDGVEAYSTLGWFKDPLLNTFIYNSEPELAELLFHELAHRRVFAKGDTDFNEGYAQFVGQEGARRWLRSNGNEQLLKQYESAIAHDQQFVQLIMRTRERLKKIYSETPPAELSEGKQRALENLLHEYEELKRSWGGYSGYDDWFSHDLNNAKLNTVANYYDFVPGFERLLEENNGDIEKFHLAAKQLSKESPQRRRAKAEKILSAPLR